jgi:hypothetical protein
MRPSSLAPLALSIACFVPVCQTIIMAQHPYPELEWADAYHIKPLPGEVIIFQESFETYHNS